MLRSQALTFVLAAAWGCAIPPGLLLANPPSAVPTPPSAATIPSSRLIKPAALAARLAGTAKRPVILQVGFRTLYDQSHIVGAEYAGAAGDADGLQRLRTRAASIPKDTEVVIYCGCCPWSDCPNMAAAYNLLQGLGFKDLTALYIPHDFGTDWVDKGFPVAKGP